jgi:His-Xaa-Ser system protein HxsD
VDLRVFPLVVIQKTAAGFSDRYTVTISQVSGEEIAVDFTVRAGSAPLPDLPIAFHDRLLDLALQEQITAQTKDIRLALVRAALAEALPQTK